MRFVVAFVAAMSFASLCDAQPRVTEHAFLDVAVADDRVAAILSERLSKARAELIRAETIPNPDGSFEHEAPKGLGEEQTWALSWSPPLDGRDQGGLGMNDDKLNPHTGQPMPEDPKPAAETPAAPADNPAETSAAGAAAAMGTDGGGSDATAPAESAAPTQQELAIRSALENVMDPEINLSVIDLGLIREIHILEDKTHIRMMLTTPFCPYAPQMVEDVKNAVLPIRAKPVDVELMPDAWSPDLMPDAGLLGYTF